MTYDCYKTASPAEVREIECPRCEGGGFEENPLHPNDPDWDDEVNTMEWCKRCEGFCYIYEND